ncbi:hypothetical protein [Amaricoccus solimangrovi]|uniref:Uncharacterized protein n=1 Tax=Amaricoccus solimangrovi TaxID=2589815 RepID=A0A501WF58_9RHOB|nr:hypothetical protein [Amaricoccus solimangrovi]TPE48493.1 hypothetical protein FJM51_17240 [Amaricoccus solimangrovi]
MTHALILGNSHTVPLRHAWSALGEEHPRHRISFFAVPMPFFRFLRLNGRRFGAPTGRGERPRITEMAERLNGRADVDLSEFDLILLVGFVDRFKALSELMLGCDVDGLREVGAQSRLSPSAFQAICRTIAEGVLPVKFLARLSAGPVAVLEKSRPAETCVGSEDPRYRGWRGLAPDPRGIAAVLGAYSDVLASVLAERDISLIRQPGETIQPNGLTAARFSQGSINLAQGEPHGEDDHSHANAAYGEICLARILDFLDAAPTPALVTRH